MRYEIISPGAFLRPFIDTCATLSAISDVVRKAYAKRVQVDREFQRRTNLLQQETIGTYGVQQVNGFVEINAYTIDLIKKPRVATAPRSSTC